MEKYNTNWDTHLVNFKPQLTSNNSAEKFQQ